MKTVQIKHSTIEGALKQGQLELGVTNLDDVEVKIIKHPGIFTKGLVTMSLLVDNGDSLDRTTSKDILKKIEKRAATGFNSNKQGNKFNQNNNGQGERPNQNNVNQAKSQPPFIKEKQSETFNDRKQKQNNEIKPLVAEQAKQNNKIEMKPQQDKQKVITEQVRNNQPKPSTVSAEELERAREKVKTYVSALLGHMSVESEVECTIERGELSVKIVNDNQILTGDNGETLEGIEYLAMQSASQNNKIKVNIDCGDFRKNQNQKLIDMALAKATEALSTNRKIRLKPMSSANRKLLHSVLSENDQVATRSEGKDPHRYLVIMPKSMAGAFEGDQPKNKNRNFNKNRKNKNRKFNQKDS